MKRLLVMLLAAAVLLCSCAGAEKPHTERFFAMDTYMTVSVYGKDGESLAAGAKAGIEALDSMLSTGNPKSEISLLNKNGSARLSEECFGLLDRAMSFNKLTDGAFNPAVYPLMELWGFPDGNYRVPAESEIKKALKLTDVSQITLDKATNEVSLKTGGMKLDLGGIGKGFASDKVIEKLRSEGASSAIVNLGGNVQTLGKKPDGSLWSVAVEHPDLSGKYLGTLKIGEAAVITSGGYERNFTENGKTYHHILNPSTGKPAESGILSATVVSEDGTLADALSTSLFVMGVEKSEELWRSSGLSFDFIIYTSDERLLVSDGIAKDFSSDKNFETVRKK